GTGIRGAWRPGDRDPVPPDDRARGPGAGDGEPGRAGPPAGGCRGSRRCVSPRGFTATCRGTATCRDRPEAGDAVASVTGQGRRDRAGHLRGACEGSGSGPGEGTVPEAGRRGPVPAAVRPS